MSKYHEDLDYLIRDTDISKEEFKEIIIEADKIISDVGSEKYKLIEPSFPDRIMRMTERYNDADIKTKNLISFSNLIIPIIGQMLTFVLGASGILACVYLATSGYTIAAIAAIISSFSPIIIRAFRNLRNK